MKLLIRIMYLLLISLIVTFSIIYLLNTNVIINELNDCSSLAMKQTQSVMRDIVISRLDKHEENLFNDLSYEEYFLNAFNSLVENSNLYDLNVIGNYSKGILYVEASVPKYPLVSKKKLLNIVDVKGDGLDDIDSLYYEETETSTQKKLDIQKWNSIKAQTLYTWNFEKDTPITNSKIEVYAINSFSESPRTKYGPNAELRCTNEDGETSLLKKGGAGKLKSTNLSGKTNGSCKLVELVITADVPVDAYADKADVIVVTKTSYIEANVKTKKEKVDYKLSEHVDVDTRYINDFEKLSVNSIYRQDASYKETLEEFINKL